MLTGAAAQAFIDSAAGKMSFDKYNVSGQPYSITNIYYDTFDDHLIRKSLLKPVYKEKLRLRAYGVPEENAIVYLEIKKKYDGIVYKRRTPILLQEAYGFIESGTPPEPKPYMNRNVMEEVEYMLSRMRLSPRIYIAYDRLAFQDPDRADFRVSFDTNIRTRRDNLRLENGSYGRALLPGDNCLMEVKATETLPDWFLSLLSEYGVRPVSFSKYGTAHLNYVRETRVTRDVREIRNIRERRGTLKCAIC